MLSVSTDVVGRDCEGLSRRDFIRVGALGLGGLALADWLKLQATARASEVDFVRDKAVVLVFLSGGASHIETFNPNMEAPAPYRSTTGEVQTSLPGVTFGGGLKMGQIVGQSTRNNYEPATEPIGPSHLMATIMHTLFDIGQLRLAAGVPNGISQLIERGEPIRELLG